MQINTFHGYLSILRDLFWTNRFHAITPTFHTQSYKGSPWSRTRSAAGFGGRAVHQALCPEGRFHFVVHSHYIAEGSRIAIHHPFLQFLNLRHSSPSPRKLSCTCPGERHSTNSHTWSFSLPCIFPQPSSAAFQTTLRIGKTASSEKRLIGRVADLHGYSRYPWTTCPQTLCCKSTHQIDHFQSTSLPFCRTRWNRSATPSRKRWPSYCKPLDLSRIPAIAKWTGIPIAVERRKDRQIQLPPNQ